MVDLSKIKPGDEVTVRVRVARVAGCAVFVQIEPDEAVCFSAGPIVSHTPKALTVGDRVRGGQWFGHIKHVDGGHAWVRWKAPELGDLQDTVERLDELVRADD